VHEQDFEQLSPLAHEHINLIGPYRMWWPGRCAGAYRELNQDEALVV
jgi:hypothetical protein